MDSPLDSPFDNEPPPMPTEAQLRADMDQSAHDVAEGRTVPWENVLAELDQIIDRTKARLNALKP